MQVLYSSVEATQKNSVSDVCSSFLMTSILNLGKGKVTKSSCLNCWLNCLLPSLTSWCSQNSAAPSVVRRPWIDGQTCSNKRTTKYCRNWPNPSQQWQKLTNEGAENDDVQLVWQQWSRLIRIGVCPYRWALWLSAQPASAVRHTAPSLIITNWRQNVHLYHFFDQYQVWHYI